MGVSLTSSVDQTLDVLLAPGRRTRLSPLVESAQLFFLTNEWPDDHKRYNSIQSILKQNQSLIEKLAKTWVASRPQQFSEKMYQSNTYLQMYTTYYSSVNVGKLQILLHELLRNGELPERLHVIDIGVGSGSTAIALLDFFYALGIACQLHHQPFPIKEFSLIGYDRSEQVLKTAESMVLAYGTAVQRRKETIIATDAESSSLGLLDKILSWVENITWKKLDIEEVPVPANDRANLIVLSNVLNELRNKDTGSCFEQSILGLSPGALIVIIEPGEKQKTQNLISWRENFLKCHSDFAVLLPCGQEESGNNRQYCQNCWAARRESFHQPLLYQMFRQMCSDLIGNPQEVDEYQNNLLSWSYCVLQRTSCKNLLTEIPSINLTVGTTLKDPIRLRVMGKFRENSNRYELVDYPVDQDPFKPDRTWDEYMRICIQPFAKARFVALKRPRGFEMPRIGFGQEIVVSNIRVEPFVNGNSQFQLIPLEANQTQIQLVNPVDSDDQATSGFLTAYDEQVRNAVDELAYRLFGFPEMRPFQHEILSRVLCGKNIFGIAATGGGKSECYILPAMVLPGVTIVVSPLKSLMTDQYDQRLGRRFGLGDLATYINGDVPFKERQARLRRMELGYYKIVFFTPEQLERGFILDSLRRTNASVGIRYLAMDEVHCVSQWGHDFRPSYLNITRRLREYGIKPVVIALTATASRQVRKDVCEELNLNPQSVEEGGDVYVYSSNRPEINFVARVMPTTDEKIEDILSELHQFRRNNQHNKAPGAALVFLPHTGGNPENTWRYFPDKTTSNKGKYSSGVTGFASYLERKLGRRVAIYHGSMDSDEPEQPVKVKNARKALGDLTGRTRIQEQANFIDSVNTGIDIMVATKGFGMGIDKSNIRLVIHRTPPSNLEAYAQEAGRAGRDGEMATAILYYSPDSPIDKDDSAYGSGSRAASEKVKSDYKIQEFFLSDKYIRKVDVIVMRAFLKQVQHKLHLAGRSTPYLYFTSDEAIDFFRSCRIKPELAGLNSPYTWPKFPEREPYADEFGEHKYLLEKGYAYEQKTRCINRILAALFRIRPNIENRLHQSFLESVQETGAKVKFKRGSKTLDWKSIYNSNAYFGEIFRRNRVTEEEFVAALQAEDLLPFARRLNVTISELMGILTDIRSADGDFVNGEWKPALLDFSRIVAPLYGPAEGKENLRDWREYAGASKRARDAYDRAKRNGRTNPTIDDWFGWTEVVQRMGWEVLPGPAFDTDFDQFLEAFMQLHDERERNDWASYHRLLTDYIGVQEDGRIPREAGPKRCLRSVLLGYLASYEVVVNGNCYSCSNCVPDGDFEKYSLEQRKKAVVRMSPALASFFDELQVLSDTLPEQEDIDRFFGHLTEEEAAGRSLFNYFSGWSGRLLNDEPTHLTVQWLRLIAMTRDILPLQPQEFLNIASSLVAALPVSRLDQLAEMLDAKRPELEHDPRYMKIWIQLYRRREQPQQEADMLVRLIQHYKSQQQIDTDEIAAAARRLTVLHRNDGPIPDEISYQHWMTILGRVANSYDESVMAYIEVAPSFDWDRILLEIQEQETRGSNIYNQAALFVTWLKPNDEEKKSNFNKWASSHFKDILRWPEQAQKKVLPFLLEELIVQSDTLLSMALEEDKREGRFIALGLKSLALKGAFPGHIVQLGSLFSSVNSPASVLEKYLPDSRQRTAALSALIPYLKLSKWTDYAKWEQLFIQNNIMPDQLGDFIRNVIQAVASSPEKDKAVMNLAPAILPYARDERTRELIIAKWFPIIMDYPMFLGRILRMLYDSDMPAAYLADQLLKKVIEERCDVLPEVPGNIGYSNWENATLMAKKIDRFIKYTRLNPGQHKIETYHLKYLRELFDWTKDPVQADMLVAILWELKKKVSTRWKTIPSLLLETLVLTGRPSAARVIAKNHPDIVFRYQGQEMDIDTLIQSVHVPPRSGPIPEDFFKIAEKSLARF